MVRTVDKNVAEAAIAIVVAVVAAVVVERVAPEQVVVVMVVLATQAMMVLLVQPAGDPASRSRLLLWLMLTFIGCTPVWHIYHCGRNRLGHHTLCLSYFYSLGLLRQVDKLS